MEYGTIYLIIAFVSWGMFFSIFALSFNSSYKKTLYKIAVSTIMNFGACILQTTINSFKEYGQDHTMVNMIYIVSIALEVISMRQIINPKQLTAEEEKQEERIIFWIKVSAGLMFITALACMFLKKWSHLIIYTWYMIVGTTILIRARKDMERHFNIVGFMLGRSIILEMLQTFPHQKGINIFLLAIFTVINDVLIFYGYMIVYNNQSKEVYSRNELFNEIMDNITVIIGKVDCQGHLIYINQQLSKLLGYDYQGSYMGDIHDILCGLDEEEYLKMMEYVKNGREEGNFQIRVKNSKGQCIWLNIHISAVLGSDGEKLWNIIYGTDVTLEKQMYEDFVKSQRKFYKLFHAIEDAIFIQPFSEDYAEKLFVQFNHAAVTNFGYDEEEYNKLSLIDLDEKLREDEKNEGDFREKVVESLIQNKKMIYETEYLTKNHHKIPVEVSSHMFMLNEEKMIMTVVRDISERNIIKRSKELEKTKSEFLANVSHELRTPLNVIITTLQLLEMDYKEFVEKKLIEGEKVGKYMGILKQNALRLLKLVNNFVCMAKIESGFYTCNKRTCNIVNLVENISDSVVTYVEGNGISFEFDTDLEEQIVSCDIEMMEKIMLNLIANAVKFTEPGGSIKVYIKDKNKYIEICVSDTGIGIPKDKQKIIFERFRQADKTFTRKSEGCGIGLSLVKSFVEMQGGKISVTSEVGKGTTFKMLFPVLENYHEDEVIYDVVFEGDELYCLSLEFSDIYKKVE